MRYRVILVLGGVFSAGLFVFLGGDEPRQAEALVMEEKQTRGFVERLTMVGGEGAAKSLAVG
jgi:hypothetical protein